MYSESLGSEDFVFGVGLYVGEYQSSIKGAACLGLLFTVLFNVLWSSQKCTASGGSVT